MRVLLVAATEAEVAPTLQALRARPDVPDSPLSVGVCITGVGLVAAAYELGKALAAGHWDFVLGAGIAGSFSKSLSLGDCVIVESEQLADFGAEDGEDFIDIFSLGFVKANDPPFKRRQLINPLSESPFALAHLPRVAGLSVTTVSGCEATIARLDDQKKQTHTQLQTSTDPKEALRLHNEVTALTTQLAEAEERWLMLQEELGEGE